VRRDNREKTAVPDGEVVEFARNMLVTIQKDMYDAALKFREENTHSPKTFDEFKDVLENKRGFLYAPWDGTAETETAIKEETKATVRCVPLGPKGEAQPGDVDILLRQAGESTGCCTRGRIEGEANQASTDSPLWGGFIAKVPPQIAFSACSLNRQRPRNKPRP
jgi:hypothetical protein